jgi:hypothetical protein
MESFNNVLILYLSQYRYRFVNGQEHYARTKYDPANIQCNLGKTVAVCLCAMS